MLWEHNGATSSGWRSPRDAGVRGLCAEGAWEATVAALRKLDLGPVCQAARAAKASGSG